MQRLHKRTRARRVRAIALTPFRPSKGAGASREGQGGLTESDLYSEPRAFSQMQCMMSIEIYINYKKLEHGGIATKQCRTKSFSTHVHNTSNNTSTKLQLQQIKLYIKIVNLKPVTPTTIAYITVNFLGQTELRLSSTQSRVVQPSSSTQKCRARFALKLCGVSRCTCYQYHCSARAS